MSFLDVLFEIGTQLASYFPYYVILVLIPMLIRLGLERLAGISPDIFAARISSMPDLFPTLAYETAFKEFVLSSMYYPLLEEIMFRALPMLFCGEIGLIVGSFVWVLMHPAWQLSYLRGFPLSRKILFTATTAFYYACCAVFYGMMWVAGAGVAAILYHMIHNGWLTLVDMIKKVEVPTPWKKFKYVSKKPVEAPMPVITEREERGEAVESGLKFVKRRSPAEASETLITSFVRRREEVSPPPASEPSEPSMSFVKKRTSVPSRKEGENLEQSRFSFVKRATEG